MANTRPLAAFAGLFYLSLYLAGKLHVFDNKGEVWKTFIVLIPTLAASLIAGSRIMDARHHPFDVISGSFLGILVAWCAYRQYFPPVTESWHKGRAHPIRVWGTEPKEPRRNYHEMSRDHSPVELLRVREQPRWDDPEHGHAQSRGPNQVTNLGPQTRSSFPVYPLRDVNDSGRDPSSRHSFDELPHHMRGTESSSSSIGLDTGRPPPSYPTADAVRGRTYGRGVRAGQGTLASSTSSLHSHEEEIEFDMAPRPLSPSKSPQRRGDGLAEDTAYHSPAQPATVSSK